MTRAVLSVMVILTMGALAFLIAQGQASALLLIVVATAILWRRGRWLAGGLLLSLTMLKPQPVVLLIPAIALWLALNRRWNALLGIALGAGTGSVASLLYFPNFIQDWQTVALSKVGGSGGAHANPLGIILGPFRRVPDPSDAGQVH